MKKTLRYRIWQLKSFQKLNDELIRIPYGEDISDIRHRIIELLASYGWDDYNEFFHHYQMKPAKKVEKVK